MARRSAAGPEVGPREWSTWQQQQKQPRQQASVNLTIDGAALRCGDLACGAPALTAIAAAAKAVSWLVAAGVALATTHLYLPVYIPWREGQCQSQTLLLLLQLPLLLSQSHVAVFHPPVHALVHALA
jgi:hypothetical protein